MSAKYTSAQKAASARYMEDKKMIKITVTKEEKEAYKRYADQRGLSMTQAIKNFFEDAIKKEKEQE